MYQNLSFFGVFLRIWFRKMFRWSLKWSFLSLQRLWVVAPSVAPPHVLLAPPFHGHLAPPPRPQKNYTVTWQQTTVHQSVFGKPLLLHCPANQNHRLLVKAHVSKLLQKRKRFIGHVTYKEVDSGKVLVPGPIGSDDFLCRPVWLRFKRTDWKCVISSWGWLDL